MKNYHLCLLFALIFIFGLSIVSNAQTLKADYQFQGNLNSLVAGTTTKPATPTPKPTPRKPAVAAKPKTEEVVEEPVKPTRPALPKDVSSANDADVGSGPYPSDTNFYEVSFIGVSKCHKGQIAAGRAIMERLIKYGSRPADGYSGRATCKELINDHRGAVTDYTSAIRLNPEYTFLYIFRANIYRTLGQTALADADDRTAVAKMTIEEEENMWGIAEERCAEGNFSGALILYDGFVKRGPDSAFPLRARAACRDLAKDYKGAISDMTKAIQLDPQNAPDGYAFRAKLYRKLGQTPLADADEKAARGEKSVPVVTKPNAATTQSGRPSASTSIGKPNMSAVGSGPYSAEEAMDARMNGIDKCRAGDFATGIAMADRLIKFGPEPDGGSGGYSARGRCKELIKDLPGAIADYSTAIKLGADSPYTWWVHLMRGTIYFTQGKVALAKADEKQCIEIGGDYCSVEPEP